MILFNCRDHSGSGITLSHSPPPSLKSICCSTGWVSCVWQLCQNQQCLDNNNRIKKKTELFNDMRNNKCFIIYGCGGKLATTSKINTLNDMWNLTSERAKHERKLAEAYLMWWTIFFHFWLQSWMRISWYNNNNNNKICVSRQFIHDWCLCLHFMYLLSSPI